MKYKILKLDFTTAVHFGTGGLEKSGNVLGADTLFSALFIESLKYGNSEKLLNDFKVGKLKISNAFPYIGSEYYVPKPTIQLRKDDEGDSIIKKALKKLKYIPLSKFESFIKGKLDVTLEAEIFGNNLGEFALMEKVSMETAGEDEFNNLYAIEIFKYKKGSGLYFFVGYEEEGDFALINRLMESLSYSGLGGKLSSGYGKFKLEAVNPINDVTSRFEKSDNYNQYMSLSICLPKDDEIERSLDNASYVVIKRSGFVASSSYAKSFRRKKDLYMLEVGSVYKNTFTGDIYDVSEKDKGSHPVYRYGIPFFMGVR